MLEVVVFFLAVFAIAAWGGLFTVFRSFQKEEAEKASSEKLKLPEDSVLRRHFLTHLQSEIESALFPRPTDSVLRRHYDSLVAAELDNRLANAE
jgi:cbb3-type cytochrome oxidase subunit 3